MKSEASDFMKKVVRIKSEALDSEKSLRDNIAKNANPPTTGEIIT
jgi:hypothetical protein